MGNSRLLCERWLTYEDAFDVIGELTFSKQLGFLEKGRDVDGIIAALEKMLDYSAVVSNRVYVKLEEADRF